jgi:type I restriction enzyme S subunit
MNQGLEAVAGALFKAWFVDFEPVRARADDRAPQSTPFDLAASFPRSLDGTDFGELPTGWRFAAVGEVADLNSWTLSARDRLDRIDYIEISEVKFGDVYKVAQYDRGSEPGRARRRLRHGDTVLSTVRPDRGSYFLCLDPSPSLVASTGFAVVSPRTVPWSFLHIALTRPEFFTHLGRLADGAAYPAVSPDVIAAWPVPVPEDERILDAFHAVCGPLFQVAHNNRNEAHTLRALRDTLLPKLLSGEVRVREAESLVEAAV